MAGKVVPFFPGGEVLLFSSSTGEDKLGVQQIKKGLITAAGSINLSSASAKSLRQASFLYCTIPTLASVCASRAITRCVVHQAHEGGCLSTSEADRPMQELLNGPRAQQDGNCP